MNSLTDPQLLGDYAERGSEAAFAELVRRHVDFVYSAALRMVRDAHLAEDVTQGVFVALAQNARQLVDRPVLSGWLHRAAQNLAANAVRSDVRRRIREQEAAAMNELLATEPDAVWEHISPHLDAALGELNEAERDAILLRYFERKSAREMAQALGLSEDAAQKRVSRATERLREFFAKRGVAVGASGLAVVIAANAVQAAPVGLAVTISTAVALAGTTIAATATATATKAIAMTTLQKTLVTASVAVLAGAGIYEARQAAQLRDQAQTLLQQQAPLARQIQQLTRERDDLSAKLTALRDENERVNRAPTELLKLRGEVTRLRNLQTESSAQRKEPSSEDSEWRPDQLRNAGRATPRSALQTFLWAAATTNLTEMAQSLVPDPSDPPSDEAIRGYAKDPMHYRIIDFLKVLSQTNLSADEVQLELYGRPTEGIGVSRPYTLRNIGGEWKLVLFNRRDADGRILSVGLGKKDSPP